MYKLHYSVIGLILNATVSLGQTTSPCQSTYGTYPTSFEGQKCWLEYAFKDSIYVYGDKVASNGIFYKPVKISRADVVDYLSYKKGGNNFYLSKNYTAWGGNWYACRNGGIVNRFKGNQDYPISTNLSWSVVKKMTKEELFRLSPAEKLDIYLNDSTFSVTKFELQKRGPERQNREDDGFCGFCNGARIAGAIMPEPKKAVTLWSIGNKSQEIEFSIGDTKALLSAVYMHPSFTFSLGLPDEENGSNNPNAGIFDLLIRLYLGKNKIPFVIDDAFGKAIFNETVLGYKRILSAEKPLSAQERTVYRTSQKVVTVNLTLYLQDELSFENSEQETISIMADSTKALNKVEHAAVHQRWVHRKNYKYALYLDNDGRVQDGKWIGEPVDFAWAAHGNGNEDENIHTNDTPGLPKSDRNKGIKWYQVKFILTQSLVP